MIKWMKDDDACACGGNILLIWCADMLSVLIDGLISFINTLGGGGAI